MGSLWWPFFKGVLFKTFWDLLWWSVLIYILCGIRLRLVWLTRKLFEDVSHLENTSQQESKAILPMPTWVWSVTKMLNCIRFICYPFINLKTDMNWIQVHRYVKLHKTLNTVFVIIQKSTDDKKSQNINICYLEEWCRSKLFVIDSYKKYQFKVT